MSKVNAWLPGVMAMLPLVPVFGAQPAPPDAELLEFLGSIDSDEEGWQEFLEQMPLKPVRVAARPVAKPTPKPAARVPPPAAVPGADAKATEDAGKVKSP